MRVGVGVKVLWRALATPLVASVVSVVAMDPGAAHVVSIGYENSGVGAATFWYGSYHPNVPFTEGQLNLAKSGGGYSATVTFNLLVTTKPAGLVDGSTNFYTSGGGLVATPYIQAVNSWQGARFTGLSAGTYTFTYIPVPNNQANPNQGGLPGPTVEWEPRNADVLSSSIVLTAQNLAGNSFHDLGQSYNQASVGAALDAAAAQNPTGAGAALLATLGGLDPAAQRQALMMLSGVGNAAVGGLAGGATNAILSSVAGRTGVLLTEVEGGSGPSTPPPVLNYAPTLPTSKAFKAMKPAQAELDKRWGSWLLFTGASGITDGNAADGSYRTSEHAWTGVGGFDFKVSPDSVVGLAIGGTKSQFSVAQALTSGSVDGLHASFYGIQKWGDSYATGRLVYGHFNVDVRRDIIGVGPAETTVGKTSGDVFGGGLEIGHIFRFAMANLTPFASLTVSSYRQQAYGEVATRTDGTPGVLGLNVAGTTTVSVPLQLGIAVDKTFALSQGWTVTPQLKASWVHEFRDQRSSTAALQSLPDFQFRVLGAKAARNGAKVVGSVSLLSGGGMEIFANADAYLTSNSRAYGGKVGLRIEW